MRPLQENCGRCNGTGYQEDDNNICEDCDGKGVIGEKVTMSNVRKASLKIQEIAVRLIDLSQQLEKPLTSEKHEKLMQDFADESDKLEEVISGL